MLCEIKVETLAGEGLQAVLGARLYVDGEPAQRVVITIAPGDMMRTSPGSDDELLGYCIAEAIDRLQLQLAISDDLSTEPNPQQITVHMASAVGMMHDPTKEPATDFDEPGKVLATFTL